MMKKFLPAVFMFILAVSESSALVRLPSIFGDNMVLQQNAIINLWGFASPLEHVLVQMNNQTVECTTSPEGKWKVSFTPMKSDGPFEMIIKGENTIQLKNILIGEVWLCSGQSNMDFPLKKTNDAEKKIGQADFSSIRIFIVKRKVALTPQDDCEGEWLVCSPKTIGDFSGVGYYFGKNLHKELNVPIGLIQSTWGGAPAEAFMSIEVLESDPDFKPILERWEKQLEKYPDLLDEYNRNRESLLQRWIIDSTTAVNKGMAPSRKPNKPEGPGSRNTPAGLYNGMLYPLVPLSLKGVIWYQGEANAGRAHQYRKLFPALIENWRAIWNVGDFSFYFVQLPNLFRQPEPSKSGWAELREAQLLALSVPNTGMAVTIDIGDPVNLHPTNKLDVGYRLSLIAVNNDYGKNDILFSGPIYQSHHKFENKIFLNFKHTGKGLAAKNGNALKGFTIASDDKKFITASAKIEGGQVIVWNDQIKNPVAVRYAWADNPDCNLYNSSNLPASPFRTDDWKEVTFNKK